MYERKNIIVAMKNTHFVIYTGTIIQSVKT